MKIRIFLFSAIYFFLSITPSFSQSLIFATQEFPPFNFTEKNKVSGAGTEIIKKICSNINIQCSFESLPWKRAQYKLQNGEADAMYVIGWNPQRDKWLYFTIPIIETEYGFFVNSSKKFTYDEPQSLSNFTIGVYGPSNTSKTLENIQKQNPTFSIDMRPDDEPGFKKVSLSRIDAVFSNKAVGLYIIKDLGLKNITYAGTYKKLNYYIGFSKNKVQKELVDEFNTQIQILLENKEIEKILKKYTIDE